jgi:hypothetical protein
MYYFSTYVLVVYIFILKLLNVCATCSYPTTTTTVHVGKIYNVNVTQDTEGVNVANIIQKYLDCNIQLQLINIDNNITQAIQQYNIDILIAPYKTEDINTVAVIANQYNIPLLVGMSTNTTLFQTYKNIYSSLTPLENYFTPAWRIAKQNGLQTIGVVSYNDPLSSKSSQVCNGSMIQAQYGLGLQLVHQVQFQTSQEYITSITNMRDIYKPDILAICYGDSNCDVIINTFKELNYMPKFPLVMDCAAKIALDQNLKYLLTDARYMISPMQWHYTLQGPQYMDVTSQLYKQNTPSSTLSAMQFYNSYIDSYGDSTITCLECLGTELGIWYMIIASISTYQGEDVWSSELATGLTAVHLTSTNGFGKISVNEFGQNDMRTIPVAQIDQNGQLVIVDGTSVIQPVPTWEQRVFVTKSLSNNLILTLLILTIFFEILTIYVSILFYKQRDNSVLKAKSAGFSLVISFASCLLFIYAFTNVYISQFTCIIKQILLMIGFPLMVQTSNLIGYRLIMINGKQFKVVRMTDRLLLKMLLASTLIPILVLLYILIFETPNVETLITDVYRPVYNYQICSKLSVGLEIARDIILLIYIVLSFICLKYLIGLSSTLEEYSHVSRVFFLNFILVIFYIGIETMKLFFVSPSDPLIIWFEIGLAEMVPPVTCVLLWFVFPLLKIKLNIPFSKTSQVYKHTPTVTPKNISQPSQPSQVIQEHIENIPNIPTVNKIIISTPHHTTESYTLHTPAHKNNHHNNHHNHNNHKRNSHPHKTYTVQTSPIKGSLSKMSKQSKQSKQSEKSVKSVVTRSISPQTGTINSPVSNESTKCIT